MDISLEEIIKNIGKEYNINENILNKIIETLNKEFFIKLADFKYIDKDIWKNLELPSNLYNIINEKI